jgi:hypothetical protein
MPKEVIRDQAELYDVHVGWDGRGEEGTGHVQVGVETHSGLPLAEVLGGLTSADPAGFRGVWGTLDRAGCNRAIRALKRARDQAYGRDE